MASRRRRSTRPARRTAVRLALVLGLCAVVLLVGSGAAQAHPLGNFTINLYDGLTVRADGIDVDYVVDMAEIPAFEEKQTIDANGDGTLDPTETSTYVADTCERLASGVSLSVANAPGPDRPPAERSRSRLERAVSPRCGSSARCTPRSRSTTGSPSPTGTGTMPAGSAGTRSPSSAIGSRCSTATRPPRASARD